MSKLFIFVGGTGIHVACALARLCYLMRTEPNNLFKPLYIPNSQQYGDFLVIDSDVNDTTADTKLWKRFINLYGQDYANNCLFRPIELTPEQRNKSNLTLRDYYKKDENFLKYLFEENTLNINLKDGFFGRPNASTLIFHDRLSRSMTQQSEDNVARILQAHLFDFNEFYYSSSIVGGTGAGCVPAFVSYIENNSSNKQIFLFLHANWFSTPKSNTNINPEDLEKNAIGGFRYFTRIHSSIKNNKTFTIIYDLHHKVDRENQGGQGQDEFPNFLYLLNAIFLWNLKNASSIDTNIFDRNIHYVETKDQEPLKQIIILNPNAQINNKNDILFSDVKGNEVGISLYDLIEKNWKYYAILKALLWLVDNNNPADFIKLIDENTQKEINKECLKLEEALDYLYECIKPIESQKKIMHIEFPQSIKDYNEKKDLNYEAFNNKIGKNLKEKSIFDFLKIKLGKIKAKENILTKIWKNL